MSNIERVIAYYDKSDDRFIGEYIIDIGIDTLRGLWDAYDGDNFYYKIYPLGLRQKGKIEDILSVMLEFDKYDYFLECHSV